MGNGEGDENTKTGRKKLAEWKNLYARGASWIQFLVNLGIITANIKLFEGFIIPLLPDGVNMATIYVACVPVYFFGCYTIGCVDKRWGIWREENDFSAFAVIPMNADIYRMMSEVHETVVGDSIEDGNPVRRKGNPPR